MKYMKCVLFLVTHGYSPVIPEPGYPKCALWHKTPFYQADLARDVQQHPQDWTVDVPRLLPWLPSATQEKVLCTQGRARAHRNQRRSRPGARQPQETGTQQVREQRQTQLRFMWHQETSEPEAPWQDHTHIPDLPECGTVSVHCSKLLNLGVTH